MNELNHRSIVNLAKTRPPKSSIELIERQCLTLLQESHGSNGNYLVSAPAGFGKTSLLVQYFNQLKLENKQVAWLSVSENDSDPIHFLTGISYALQSLGKNIGVASQALIGSGMVLSFRVILTTLMNEILSFGEPITIILDDLHRSDSADIEDIMVELLGSGPDNLRIIIASRSSFAKFGKLRARKNLIEISADDLRVNYSEAVKILSSKSLPSLSNDNIGLLLERVDGWINGLYIASLSLKKDSNIDEYIRRFSGRESDFSEYIEYDIFSQLPDLIKNFLIETSILEILTPELCDAVTERHDSDSILAQLRRKNLFIVTLDEQLSCYRYHHIFRSFLQTKMSSRTNKDLHLIHRRAYKWCIANNLLHEAINHMLVVEDWDYAADAIENSLEMLLSRNRLATLAKWINRLPVQYVQENPCLQLGLGWVAILQRDFSTAIMHCSKAESTLVLAREQNTVAKHKLDKLLSNIEAQKGVITVVSDNEIQISEFANTVEINISKEHIFFRNTYIAALVYALMHQGRFDEGHRLAIENDISGDINNFRATVYILIFRGLGYRLSGHLKQANELYEKAQLIAGKGFKDQWMPFAVPSALSAEIYYEWGDFSRASECIQNSAVVRHESSVIEPLVCYYQTSSKLAIAEGDVEKALQFLAEGEAIGKKDNYSRLVAAMLSERIRLLCKHGKLESAETVFIDLKKLSTLNMRQDSSSHEYWSEVQYYVDMGACMYFLGIGKPEQTIPILNRQSALARKLNQDRHLIKILLIEASALLQLGKDRSVLNRLTESIQLGAKGNFLQTFIESDPALHDAFQKTLSRWPNDDDLNSSLEGEQYLTTLKENFGVSRSTIEEITTDINDIEPLTPRELDLLRLLAKGLKNKELAIEMSVSQHTIAWHLKNLYAKLRVANRTAAVTVARHFQL
ncbi:LuxR C-terminal-related transcriptional regulator [Zhongshania arctica]|uniref:LuxR C-terminal-related transcriptional regulator n=1 Tax=Zhongshania arctica TaxID=3238302 RepID=A0ABV3TV71_9GAMM